MKAKWLITGVFAALALGGAALGVRHARRAEAKQHFAEQVRQVAAELKETPTELRDGDLIFQESTSRQSEMVRALTRSRWTHMGVIFQGRSGAAVFEASSPVRETPLAEWIARGHGHLYVVKRLRDADTRLSAEAVGRMKSLGKTWLGRPYDLRFRWDDQAIYCSELAYKLFERGLGVRLGKLQRAADMNLSDERVRQALLERFGKDGFNAEETVITPDAIFQDPQLLTVEL